MTDIGSFRVDERTDFPNAFKLAKGVLKRHAAQPIALAQEETELLAIIVLWAMTGQRTFFAHHFDPGDTRYLKMNSAFTPTLIFEPSTITTDSYPVFADNLEHLNFLRSVLKQDEAALYVNDPAYDASWKKREGHSAFENLCRKWDRIYARVKKFTWDLFIAARDDRRREGVIQDIRDLRRYLALAECELLRLGYVQPEVETKDTETQLQNTDGDGPNVARPRRSMHDIDPGFARPILDRAILDQ
jgi:hypothetical protein